MAFIDTGHKMGCLGHPAFSGKELQSAERIKGDLNILLVGEGALRHRVSCVVLAILELDP